MTATRALAAPRRPAGVNRPAGYYCVTHRPLEWPLPPFMQAVSISSGLGPGVTDLAAEHPELAGRDRTLGEYAALFALRRKLQATWDGEPPAEAMLGLAHYRRFATTRPLSAGVLDAAAFRRLSMDVFLPGCASLVVPEPLALGTTVLNQYAHFHVTRDLLLFMAIAVDLGVVENRAVADFLSRPTLVATPSVGVYPARWLLVVLEALESVVDAFEQTVGVDREGYQRRATGFCCERLHAMLAWDLASKWVGPVHSHPPLMVSADGQLHATI